MTIQKYLTDLKKFLEEDKPALVKNIIEKHSEQLQDSALFHRLAGDHYFKQQEFSKAINCYRKSLQIEPGSEVVSNKIKYLSEILEKSRLDIYASTNLNLDPWFD